MPLYLEGRSLAVEGRRLTVTREKPFVIRTKTTNHDAGEVKIGFADGSYQLDNGSRMRCRINGLEQKNATLVNGDELEIGKDRFAVVIQPEPRIAEIHAADDHDDHATDSLPSVAVTAVNAAAQAVEVRSLCAVCDAQIVISAHNSSWSDGDRSICARCLAKGVKPDHLPRPFAMPPSDPTPVNGSVTLADLQESAPPQNDPRVSSSQMVLGVPDPGGDSTAELIAPAAEKPTEETASSDSDRQRQSRRISASRLTVVEPAQKQGLFKMVSKAFGRRDERHQRLTELEAARAALLAEAGRHALGAGGNLGLPEKAVATLLAGGTVTVSANDLSPADLGRWRAQRQRMVLLDAEIAALRRGLGLGSDPQLHAQSSPTARPDQKAMQDRAFATLDGLSTDELPRDGSAQPDDQQDAEAQKSSPSGRLRPVPRRRR
jgi:hypothetical protein